MRFTYTYRSSDGQRHTAEVEAESRDAAFATIRRELGIKPIKMVAADVPGEGVQKLGKSSSRLVTITALLLIAIIVGVVAWWFGRRGGTPETIMVTTPQGVVAYTVASPLPRQAIPGNRNRVDAAVSSEKSPHAGAFESPAEAWLARYAEPGRAAGHAGARPSLDDFKACLKEPIRIASNDFTEVVDLKRIVTGMKLEMQAYLAGGGTMEGYLAELEKRQRLEISYRENAEKRIDELLSRQHDDGKGAASSKNLREAYSYWLKANAQLQSMGIYPIALPDVLRAYQTSLDIDE